MKVNTHIRKLTVTAMLFALGVALPLLTGQIPTIGRMLLPMHIPVFLAAFLCGAEYAAPMAFFLPLFRAFLFARPTPYPDAPAIALELAAYALIAGLLWRCRKHSMGVLYAILALAMLGGRMIRTLSELALLAIADLPFAFDGFFTVTILGGIPGILLQFLFIPAVMLALGELEHGREKCKESVSCLKQNQME